MSLFKKKPKTVPVEHKCPAKGCPFVFSDPNTLKRHVEWAHGDSKEADKHEK